MSTYRQIHTKIWRDDWFLDLTPAAKLLFIHLFSNAASSISGLYELPIKVIEFETGLDRDTIIETLDYFDREGKVMYEDGVVWIPTLAKYNASNSPKVKTRIQTDLAEVHDCPLKRRAVEALGYGTDTVSVDYGYQFHKEKEKEKEKEQKQENNTSLRDGETPLPAKRKKDNGKLVDQEALREDQAIWCALRDAIGSEPATKAGRGAWNAAIMDMRNAGVKAGEIPQLCVAYRARWKEEVELTPTALAKHLHVLRGSPPPNSQEKAQLDWAQKEAEQQRVVDSKQRAWDELIAGRKTNASD